MRAVRERFAARLARERSRSGVYPRMSMQIAAVLKTFSAHVAHKRTPVCVDPSMLHQISVRVEPFPANLTLERLLPSVRPGVVEQLCLRHELFTADVTDKHLNADVNLFMFADSTQLEEALVTDGTSIRSISRVCPSMVCQTRTANKSLTTYVTHKRPVTTFM